MPVPLYTPRVNNNDDTVRYTHQFVTPGTFVRKGDPVADVETDKATFTVEAEDDGFVLAFTPQIGNTIDVGSVLAWMGATADEALPAAEAKPTALASDGAQSAAGSPSLKAALLLAQYGLKGSDIAASGDRLSAADVERHIAQNGLQRRRPAAGAPAESRVAKPPEPGKLVDLTGVERGVLQTVSWQKAEAVPAYLEFDFDPEPWARWAAEFQQHHRLFLSPLLSLFAWRLARLATEQPTINATLSGKQKHIYQHVNIGFTVQSGNNLFVVVVRQAETMSAIEFVQKLGELQRAAIRNKLQPDETSGATIGFSSMARWPVVSHMPVLLPHTALMIAHAAGTPEHGTRIGATYDHRLLSGFDAAQTLQQLTTPPETEPSLTSS